jgi:glycosyltransferase involved in cell wall biosynthesis
VGFGSTGKIVHDEAEKLVSQRNEVTIAYGRDFPMTFGEDTVKYKIVRIGNNCDNYIHAIETRFLDLHGFGSKNATKKFLKWCDTYNPDVIHLHNVHDYYINIELLFDWIKNYEKRRASEHKTIEIRWTLHDCWTFTGHCSHFSFIKCNQWKGGCGAQRCPQLDQYPKTMYRWNVKKNWERKKMAFCGVHNLTIYTPSKWLAGLVKQSFLSEYPIEVHYNVIDNTIFKPTKSNFRSEYNLENKIISLTVSNIWNDRKGFNDIIRLRELLDDRFAIVMVGVSEEQKRVLPDGIIAIGRMQDQKRLAAIYSAADFFINPSREETFGLTTAEAIACGTQSIVYKYTACEEVVEMSRVENENAKKDDCMRKASVAVEQSPEAIRDYLLSTRR